MLTSVRQTFDLIAKNPSIGTLRHFNNWPGIRSRKVRNYGNYLVFFRVQDQAIEILRVLHGRRDLPKQFE